MRPHRAESQARMKNGAASSGCMSSAAQPVHSDPRLLTVAKTEDDIAVVLSHEVAHAVLQHSNERMSQPLVKKLVGIPTSIAVGVCHIVKARTDIADITYADTIAINLRRV